MLTPLDYAYISSSDRGSGNRPFSLSPQEAYLLFLLVSNLIELELVAFFNVSDYDELDAFLSELCNKLMSPDEADDDMIGEIKFLSYDDEPVKWMKCDGRVLLRDEYPDLFAVIGTAWGSTNSNNFMLPDARMRSPMGEGALLGNTELNGTFDIGFQSVDYQTTLLVENLPPHNHAAPVSGAANGSIGNTAVYGAGLYQSPKLNTDNTGSGTPFNNIHPVFVVNAIIRVLP